MAEDDKLLRRIDGITHTRCRSRNGIPRWVLFHVIEHLFYVIDKEKEMDDNWIRVEDELPPSGGEEVWCWDTEEGAIIGSYSQYGWFDVYGEDDGRRDSELYRVTHWQPLRRPGRPEDV